MGPIAILIFYNSSLEKKSYKKYILNAIQINALDWVSFYKTIIYTNIIHFSLLLKFCIQVQMALTFYTIGRGGSNRGSRMHEYGHELPFADGCRIGRSWRTTGRLPERLMSEPRANIPTPLVPSWWSPRLVPRSPRPRSTGWERREKGLLFRFFVATVEEFVTFVNGFLSPSFRCIWVRY